MKANLKVLDPEPKKRLDDMTMLEITGKVQDRSHLKPPRFEDATNRETELSPFKKRINELFKGNK